MGGACLNGWLSSKEGIASTLNTENFVCVIPDDADRELMESDYGIECVANTKDLTADSAIEMILLAVKPQVLPIVLDELAQSGLIQAFDPKADPGSKNPLILSIAAGISTSDIEAKLPKGMRVVRAMPNMPLQVGRGATAVCKGECSTYEDVDVANQLFSTLGISSIVDEDQIDAICAISGGGPAYVAYMIEALRDAGVGLGLDASLAENLALETVGGTYESMIEKGLSPEEMRRSVCSPGGTTLAALEKLDDANFTQMFAEAMRAAVDRAEALRKGE